MKRPKTICQSCAIPLSQAYDHGTEKDGSPSALYCRRCYRMGDFTEPQMTAERMYEVIRVRMVLLKFPRFLAKLAADRVYGLRRWMSFTAVVPPLVPIPAQEGTGK